MPWLGITAIALAGWYLFFHHSHGHWYRGSAPSAGEIGPWTYQAGNDQLWIVSQITLGDVTSWSAVRPGTGEQITAQSLDDLTTRIDNF